LAAGQQRGAKVFSLPAPARPAGSSLTSPPAPAKPAACQKNTAGFAEPRQAPLAGGIPLPQQPPSWRPGYLCGMEFQKKKYGFRGMDGFAGFRNGQEYELELGVMDAEDEAHPGEIVIINPVSKIWTYCSRKEFTERWEKR
jgi:hypothetical protein